MTVISANEELIQWLIENRAIQFGGHYLSKCGESFNYETDIREVYKTVSLAMKTSNKILATLEIDLNNFDYFVGIPETGSLIASYLNIAKYLLTKKDFPINQLRTHPKEYQVSTNSVHTVLPLDPNDRVCIVEDDVVSGQTLLRYLETVENLGVEISNIVSVIDREFVNKSGATVRQQVKKQFNRPYKSLVTMNEVMKYLDREEITNNVRREFSV